MEIPIHYCPLIILKVKSTLFTNGHGLFCKSFEL